MTVFVDVDQVLADWIGQLCLWLGLDRAAIEAAWERDVWDVCAVIVRLYADRYPSKEHIWQVIDRMGVEFWSTVPPLPWMRAVLDVCAEHGRVVLLTRPSHHPSSVAGKLMWMQTHFGARFTEYQMGHPKEVCAPGILVDDHPKNCDLFVREGGQAVLFPAHGNINSSYLNNPVGFLRHALEAL